MTFSTYKKNPELNKDKTVMLTSFDCEYIIPEEQKNSENAFYIGLTIADKKESFIIKKSSNFLYKISEMGSVSVLSNFILLEDSEKKIFEEYNDKQKANSVIDQLATKELNEIIFPC